MKLVFASALALVIAPSAFASKARIASLNGSTVVHDDAQSIFDNPARMFNTGDFLTMEFGATSNTSVGITGPENSITNGTTAPTLYAADAEGGFIKTIEGRKYGFYLGRKSVFTTRIRQLTGFQGQDNPIEVLYGQELNGMKFGFGFNYSNSTPHKNTGATTTILANDYRDSQSAMGTRWGLTGEDWDLSLVLGLGSKAKGTKDSLVKDVDSDGVVDAGVDAALVGSASTEYKGTTGFKLAGGKWFGSMYAFGSYYQDGAKITGITGVDASGGAATSDVPLTGAIEYKKSQMEIGLADVAKFDGGMFFYSISYLDFKGEDKGGAIKNASAALNSLKEALLQKTTSMPLVIGVEAKATEWLTLRSSVKQNVLLSSNKKNDGKADTLANSTTVAAGAGVKFGKFNLDATLAASSVPGTAGNGELKLTNLLSNASMTYNF